MDLSVFKDMQAEGKIVVAIILALFVLAVILLFVLSARYTSLQHDLSGKKGSPKSSFALKLREDFVTSYRRFGTDTNTPAIINNAVSVKLGRLLFFERFMNNAVSLFVTLGLFGTFLGLALSVGSLTQLLGTGNSSEWLNMLDNVGSGLFSALSGMGVAFYTSLVGVSCSILFTILRAIVNPQAKRDQLEVTAELWLDHTVASVLREEIPQDDTARLITLKKELRRHASAVSAALNDATANMQTAMTAAAESMQNAFSQAAGDLNASIEYSKEPLRLFYDTVRTFNDNVRDFSTINYDLRGSVERMDLAARDLGSALNKAEKKINANADGGTQK